MNKIQLLLCLAIGNILGGLIYSQTALSVSLDDVFDAPVHLINSLAAGKSEAQTPFPVPQAEPPIGNSGNQAIQPCAAPPPTMATQTEEMPPSPMARSFRQETSTVAVNPPALKPVAPAVEETPQTVPTEVATGRVAYNQGGSITQAQADRMSRFKKNQSYKAIRSLLGTPNYREPDADIYVIEGTGDQGMAPRKLIVFYALDAEDNFTIPRATNWRIQ